MKVTLFQTLETLDPTDFTTYASLERYIIEVSSELEKAFPQIEIDFQEVESSRSWELSDLTIDQEENRWELEQEIQDITETVFSVGNFWE